MGVFFTYFNGNHFQKSDGSGVTVTRDGGTTTVTDGLGIVLSQSSNKSAGSGISISPVSGNSNESCAEVPQVSNEPEAQQSLKPTAPVTVPATDIPREELKKAIVQALLQLLLEKAVK